MSIHPKVLECIGVDHVGVSLAKLIKSLDVDINDLGSKSVSIEFLVSFKNMLSFH